MTRGVSRGPGDASFRRASRAPSGAGSLHQHETRPLTGLGSPEKTLRLPRATKQLLQSAKSQVFHKSLGWKLDTYHTVSRECFRSSRNHKFAATGEECYLANRHRKRSRISTPTAAPTPGGANHTSRAGRILTEEAMIKFGPKARRCVLMVGLAMMTFSNGGCTLIDGFAAVTYDFMLFWRTLPFVPVSPYFSQRDRRHLLGRRTLRPRPGARSRRRRKRSAVLPRSALAG